MAFQCGSGSFLCLLECQKTVDNLKLHEVQVHPPHTDKHTHTFTHPPNFPSAWFFPHICPLILSTVFM